MKCKQVQNDLVALLKGEINETDAKLMQEHLAQCSICQKEKQAVNQLLNLVKTADRIEPAEHVWTGLKDRIKQAEAFPPKPVRIRWLVRGVAAAIIIALLLGAFILVRGNFLTQHPHQRYVAEITSIIGEGTMAEAESLPLTGFVNIDKPLAIPANLEVAMDLISSGQGSYGSLTIKGPARLEFKGHKHLMLEQGEARLKLTKAQKGWLIQTSHGSVKTLGTSFTVKATPVNTVVVVTEGKVKFYNRAGSVIVASGFQSYVREQQKPVHPIPLDTVPLVNCTRTDVLPVTPPLIKLIPERTVFKAGEVVHLKWQITNRDEDLWFSPFLKGSAYLFLNVTNPQGKMFYARFDPAEARVKLPVGFREEAGLVSFPRQATYEITCRLKDVFGAPGKYQLVGVYGAAPRILSNLKVWCGLIESEPIQIEIK